MKRQEETGEGRQGEFRPLQAADFRPVPQESQRSKDQRRQNQSVGCDHQRGRITLGITDKNRSC